MINWLCVERPAIEVVATSGKRRMPGEPCGFTIVPKLRCSAEVLLRGQSAAPVGKLGLVLAMWRIRLRACALRRPTTSRREGCGCLRCKFW